MEAKSINDDQAELVLVDIERSEQELLAIYGEPVSLPGPIGYQHIYLFGIARRALAQSTAFRQMVLAKNSLVASSILRLQLDTVLRLYALFWVAEPEDFAKKVFNGTAVDKLKAADGSLMKDAYLKERVAVKNEWIPAVYAETSGYIHFSHRHIKAALRMENAMTGSATIQIGSYDPDKSIGYYGELLRAFLHLNMMIPVASEDWFRRIKANGSSAGFGELSHHS